MMKQEGRSNRSTLAGGHGSFFILPSPFCLYREQTAEIQIAARVRCVQQQRGCPDVQLGANNRLDAGRLCGLHEFNDAMKIARVGQGDRWQVVLFCQFSAATMTPDPLSEWSGE